VGIWSLGIAPDTADPGATPEPSSPFAAWIASQWPDSDGKTAGAPGIYVPEN
jgi:hypothetical protein